IDTLETILLSRPFLAKIHAQIDVFRGEISLGVGNEKVKIRDYGQSMKKKMLIPLYWDKETFHYSEESVGTVDSSSDSQENEVGSHLSEIVKEDFNFGVNIGRTKDDPYSRNFDVGIKRLFEAVWKLLLLRGNEVVL
ncbi:hypothetical protein Tco_1268835, partial [Tanacetum coccineum]